MVYDIYLFVKGKLMKLLMTRLTKENLFMQNDRISSGLPWVGLASYNDRASGL